MAEVWVPGNLMDLEALKRQYDTVVFTRAAVGKIEHALVKLRDRVEHYLSNVEDDAAEAELDEAQVVLEKLREVL